MSGHELSWWQNRENWRAILGVLILVLVGWSVWNNYEVTTCQADFNIAFAKGLEERTVAATNERHAQRVMLDTILNPAAPREEKAQSLVTWRTALDEADRKRDANPLPKDPRCS